MGKRKYPKTKDYYVYSHKIDDVVYYGVSKMQPHKRWKKALYKTTALAEYLDRWDEIQHEIIKDGLNKSDAYALEDWYIQNTPNCINKQRSGLIEVSDKNAYNKQRNKRLYAEDEEYRESKKAYQKQYREEHREEYKQYREEHKEEKKEYNRLYYQENKEKKKQYIREYRAKKRA